jgi:hypothetical protein
MPDRVVAAPDRGPKGGVTMAIKQAMWVHGTSVQAEREGFQTNRVRPGWGARFAGHGAEWFHFAIPSPVIFGGKNSDLQKAFVFYKTTMGAKLTAVHLYDGKKKIKAYDGLSLSGTHDGKVEAANTFQLTPIHIKFGLGISVNVDFGQSTPQGVPSVTFAAAGADFIIPS